MPELDPRVDKPIHAEFPQFDIQPVEPVGWSATETTESGHVHVIAAPTIHELRLKLRETTGRASRPRPFLESS